MTSKDSIICPFCKQTKSKSKVLGTSEKVNYSGYDDLFITCDSCGKDFYCDIIVSYTFKTRKNY